MVFILVHRLMLLRQFYCFSWDDNECDNHLNLSTAAVSFGLTTVSNHKQWLCSPAFWLSQIVILHGKPKHLPQVATGLLHKKTQPLTSVSLSVPLEHHPLIYFPHNTVVGSHYECPRSLLGTVATDCRSCAKYIKDERRTPERKPSPALLLQLQASGMDCKTRLPLWTSS